MTNPPPTPHNDGGDVVARLNRLPVATRSHRRWAVLLAGIFLFELADIQTFGLVAPELKDQWHLSVGDIGLVTSLAFLGMFFGAIVGGRASDVWGRKWPLIGSTAFFSVFSLLGAASPNLAVMGVIRVLTGFGLTAMTIIGLAYISEMYPRDLRGRYLAIIFGTGLLGIPVVSWFARFVVPSGPDGWRWVFVFGGLGLLFALGMVRGLPESARWQADRGRSADAEELTVRLEAEARAATGAPLPEPAVEAPAPPSGRMRELFNPTYRKRTITLLVVSVFTLLGFYGFNGWVPTLLVEHGFKTVESLTYTSIVSIGAIPGALLAWPFIDRLERKYAAGAIYVVIAVLAVVYGFAGQVGVILISGFLISMLLQTSTVFMYTYGPEIYPTRLRALGGGLGNGTGRLATFGGGNLVPVIYETFGYAAVFIYIAGVLAISGILLATLGERTTRRTLEHIADETRPPSPAPTGDRV